MLSFLNQGCISSQELLHVWGLYEADLFSLLLFPSVITSWESLSVFPSQMLFTGLGYFICCFPLMPFIVGK